MKTILKLFSVLLLSTIVNASSSWIPIVMGDIMTFVPSVSISPVVNTYPVNATVSVNVNGTLPNKKDWIGIFKKGTQKKWGNQIAWSFVEGKSRVALTRNKLPMPAGEYEVALFFNNSLNKVEATATFDVITKPTLTNYKTPYAVGESIWIQIHNKRDTTAHPKDWIGIYPKTSNNDWGNVLGWTWVKDESPTQSGEHDWYKFDGLAAGDYEARLFFDNTYHLEAKTAFKIVGEVPHNDYGKAGPYINEVKIIHNNNDGYIAYYPEHHVGNAPIVLVLGATFAEGTYVNGTKTTLRNEGLMRYLASLGCYVIGNKKQGVYDNWPKEAYDVAMIEAINKGADKTRLALMGHSSGAMASYKMMKQYRSEGYGGTKNFIIDLHGYYAVYMKKEDLQVLDDTDTLMLMYGGLNGNANQTGLDGKRDFSEDPRTLLTLTNLMPDNTNKSFMVVNTRDHFYSWGEWEATEINGNKYAAIKDKNELLEPIDAMVKYEFFNSNGQYNDARTILFDSYEETIQNVYDATLEFLNNGNHYSFVCYDNKFEINYCNDHGLQ